MSKKEDAKAILSALKVPKRQQNDICCYTLLALANIDENSSWKQATNNWIGIHSVREFVGDKYGVYYAENTRETFRKNAMHNFRNAAFIEDNDAVTNSKQYSYRLTDEMLCLIQSYCDEEWETNLATFQRNHESLIDIYASKRKLNKIPVKINVKDLTFSRGKHNELQKKILEEFASRFAPNSECLYVGDTIKKDLVKDEDALRKLGFSISVHNKMPDVVLYSEEKNWLFFIEAVTSVGPMDYKRKREIDEMTKKVTAGKIYITAFLDRKTYKKFFDDLAWETEVWIADEPDHMIHLNGDKFLGPR